MQGGFDNRLASGDGPYDEKRFLAGRDLFGQWSIGRFVGKILLAGEETQEGAALPSNLIADGAAEHGIAKFERIQRGSLRGRTFDLDLDLAAHARQRSQMLREDDSNCVGTHFILPSSFVDLANDSFVRKRAATSSLLQETSEGCQQSSRYL